jgi:hypothetical protein
MTRNILPAFIPLFVAVDADAVGLLATLISVAANIALCGVLPGRL